MSLHSKEISDALWMAQVPLELTVLGAMYHRKLFRSFPIFFAYLICQAVSASIEIPIYKWEGYAAYFYTYWVLQAVSLALGFEVIHEIFLDVFRPYHALKDLGTLLFKWAALVMLLVAGVVAASSPPGSEGPLVQSVLTVQRCIRVIQCGLILFLLVFSKYVGVSWKQHSFGIALGFGSFATVELAMVALNVSGHLAQRSMNLPAVLAYNLTIVIWMVYAFHKSPAREGVETLLMTQRWDQSLTDLQHPVASDSLIPLFEGMVDRAFSRSKSEYVREELPAPASAKAASASGRSS